MKKYVITALTFAPSMAFAAGSQLNNVKDLLRSIGDLIDIAIPIVVALGLLAFFWGLVMFIFGAEEKKSEGRHIMIWGLVALFVMVSVWGLVRFIGNALGVNEVGGSVAPPSVQLK
jgi:hypothetical protein